MKLSHKSVLLVVLWITWFLLLPTLFVVSAVVGDEGRFEPFRCTSSLVLAIAAWTNSYSHRDGRWSRFAALIALGMTWGMLADLYGTHFARHFELHALSVTVPLFALGHVAYIGGMLDVARRMQLTRRPPWRRVVLLTSMLYCLIGVVLWWILVYPSDDLPHAHLPTCAYTIFLALAAGIMATVSVFEHRFLWMAVGGFLFLVSDAFLAVGLFQDNWRNIGDLCWITYGIGQMLIVYGAIAGVRDTDVGFVRSRGANFV